MHMYITLPHDRIGRIAIELESNAFKVSAFLAKSFCAALWRNIADAVASQTVQMQPGWLPVQSWHVIN
jgi:hypothetical protein